MTVRRPPPIEPGAEPAREVDEEKPKRAPRPAKEREELIYDTTNERVVIGAAIADRARRDILTRSIAADEFLVPEHAAKWRALRLFTDQGMDYDPQVMRRLVQDEGATVADEYLLGLEELGAPANLDWHVSTLRWDATRARVVSGSLPELVKVLRDPKAGPDAVSAAARSVLRAVDSGGGGRRFIRRPDELARSYKAEIRARVAVGNFYPYGYAAIDENLVEGSMPGKTGLLVGLSGSGKSTATADWVRRQVAAGRRVLYGAWEMGASSTLDILVASMARIELERIVQGTLDPAEVARVDRCIDWLTSRITFMDNAFFGEDVRGKGGGRKSNDRALDVLEGYIAESGCDVIVMDLWERALADLSYDGITTALYRQQEMHARYNVYGLIVHQLKLKEVETRADKRPTRESIKGTGAFVEVADQIFGIHRDAQFRQVPDDAIEWICLKQRKGRAFWAVRVEWSGELALLSGDGVSVPYDPGLENSAQFGDVGEINVKRSRAGGKRKPSRRDG